MCPFVPKQGKKRFVIQFRTLFLNVNLSQALQTAFQLHRLARAQATLWCVLSVIPITSLTVTIITTPMIFSLPFPKSRCRWKIVGDENREVSLILLPGQLP